MISRYVRAALEQARYEILEDGTYYGEISALPGVYSNTDDLESCRDELHEVLEEWILLRLSRGLTIPAIGECSLTVPELA